MTRIADVSTPTDRTCCQSTVRVFNSCRVLIVDRVLVHSQSRRFNAHLLSVEQAGAPGFKAEFGAKNIPSKRHFSAGTFKAGFNVTGTEWQTVKIPFSEFSYDWSDFTGRCDTKDPNNGTQHVCCSAEHPEVCPTAAFLGSITSVAVWAEGVAGDFHIEIKGASTHK